MRIGSRSLLALSALALAACGPGTQPITIDLVGRVGSETFECGASYDGIGTSATTLEALDFRFYVHDVRVVTDAGEVPVTLLDDGMWQHGGVALLDFEDGCDSRNAPMNGRLVGTVPEGTRAITGLRFRVGVPAARNHLDAASQPAPLSYSQMFWGWQDGYKYVRIEGRTTGQPGYVFHLGATGCSGEASMGTRVCARPHVPSIELDGFDPASDVVVADLAALFAGSDLDVDAGGAPGCQADESDPDCAPIFEAIGLGAGPQTFFRVEARAE